MTEPAPAAVHGRLTRLMFGDGSRRALIKRGLAVLGIAVLLSVALVAARLAPLLLEPNRYATIASIERNADYRDATLMREAWSLPVAALYAQQIFEFQHNQSFCGPTSAADVLHSMGDPRSQDQMLANTSFTTWFGYLPGGLTLDQEADLLRRQSGRLVRVLRGLSLEQFRAEMHAVNDPGRRYIVNFHRGPIFGRGHGHFSPLLAYLPEQDLVLVGDVNSDYRPFLVAAARLWQATETIDDATGEKRGLAVLSVDLSNQSDARTDASGPDGGIAPATKERR
ncbi:MAG: phytochelatin synthase family protein [Xanthobacteraceae bacterium]|nr:phytochelatin synthase family protein [Xanthobacteraceae bacterium]